MDYIRNGNVRKLTDNQKVELVLQKELRPTATSTNYNIASQFQVSTDLVNRTNKDTLTQRQKELYEQRKQQLKHDALELTSNSIKKANELVNIASSPNHLSGVVAAMGKANEILRLENGEPTSITSEQNTDKVAQAFSHLLRTKRDQGIELPTDNELISLIETACKANNADVESVKKAVFEQSE